MDKEGFERLAKNLQRITSCPGCGSHYALADIRYFGQLGMTIFIQLTCHHCQAPVFAGVPLGADRLKEESEAREQFYQSVTYDDALGINKLLEQRDLDFSQLFHE